MEYETEDQQVEALKRWWEENGKSVIAGVVIGGGVIGGWQFWKSHQESQAVAASDGFSQALEAVQGGELASVSSLADEIVDDHSGSVYASYAQFVAARAAVENGDLEDAAARLAWVAEEASQPDVKLIAQIRLSRVHGALGEAQRGLDALPGSYPESFTALVEEARGDLLSLLGDAAAARAAYEAARDTGQAPNAEALRMKIDDLPVASAS